MVRSISKNTFSEILINQIVEGSSKVREAFNEGTITELGASMGQVGILQPLVIEEKGKERYELIIGSRRLRAAKKQGLTRVPVIIISNNIDDREKLLITFSENLHREDLTPFEEATAIMRLIRDFGMNMNQIATEIGRSTTFVKHRVQLLNMPQAVQEMIAERTLRVDLVGPLTYLGTHEEKIALAKTAVKERLDGKELLSLIRERHEFGKRTNPKPMPPSGPKKLCLKISVFTQWLEVSISSVEGMTAGEIREVKERLEKMQRKLQEVLESTERAYRVAVQRRR